MKKIIISPFSKNLRNGNQNAKNYPYWEELVQLLNTEYHTIQIGTKEEPDIKCHERKINISFSEIKTLIEESYIWISVDNFLPHLCNAYRLKPGYVIFGRSNPKIFGYEHNINIFKDRKNFRINQFDFWENETYNKDIFLTIR